MGEQATRACPTCGSTDARGYRWGSEGELRELKCMGCGNRYNSGIKTTAERVRAELERERARADELEAKVAELRAELTRTIAQLHDVEAERELSDTTPVLARIVGNTDDSAEPHGGVDLTMGWDDVFYAGLEWDLAAARATAPTMSLLIRAIQQLGEDKFACHLDAEGRELCPECFDDEEKGCEECGGTGFAEVRP